MTCLRIGIEHRAPTGEDVAARDIVSHASTPAPDRMIFDSGLVSAGEFRCPVGHPRFEDSGPTRQYCFVFPRNACWIEHEGSRPFVADATVVPLYNQGHPYRRGVISPDGDRTIAH